eukprot:TRINITY_DN4874_c0_g1_i3.p1 TRINITY_DN4874_c0_g1~~TRINITY_DN4874_c0_g1_i3.p1  ORF type:complete len:888 (+),score=183.04 TRINITY_DN4874_c0_g1_i3:92-2755(+)
MVAEEVHGCGPSNGTNGNFGSRRTSRTWPGLNAGDFSSGSEEHTSDAACRRWNRTLARAAVAPEAPASSPGVVEATSSKIGGVSGACAKNPNIASARSPVLYEGKVMAVDQDQTYGFIRSREVSRIYGCDVLFFRNSLPEAVPGDRVVFRVRQTKKGKPQAVDLRFTSTPIAASFRDVAALAPLPTNAMFSDADGGPTSDDHAAGAAEDAAEEAGDSGGGEYASGGAKFSGPVGGGGRRAGAFLNGDTTPVGAIPTVPKERSKKAKDDNYKSSTVFEGKIAIIYEEKGFGFIESQGIRDICSLSTVFVHCKNLHGFEVGDRVSFSLSHSSKSGKPQAHSLNHLERRRGMWSTRAEHGTWTSVRSGPAPSSAEWEAEAERLAAAGTSGDDRPTLARAGGKLGALAGGCGNVLSTTQTPTQAFYEGTIKSFDPGKGAGYISSPEARREFGRDVLVLRRQQSASDFREGDEVKFELRMNKKKYPQAFNVCVTKAAVTDEELNKDIEDYTEVIYQGTIKMVDPDKGYGFIRCMDLHSVYNSDIFVHRKHLAGFSLGDLVTFCLQFDSQNRPQAVSLQDAEEPTTNEAPLTGTIKSFALEHGYGFISSLEAREFYGGVDVFVHSKQIKHFVPGDHVTFIVKVTGHGRPQAYCLELAPNTVGWLAGDEDVPAKPLPLPDPEATYIGEIKSFSAKDGYGFIGCQQLSDHFGRDVFLHTMQYEGLAIGDRVEFKVKVRKGAPQAYDIVRLPSLLEEEGGEGQAGARPEVTPEQLVVLNRKLMRACASAMVDSAAEMDSLLRAGADPHARDATGDSALMVSALNVRNAERKCKLLIESRADPMARANEDEGNEQTVIEWARERLSPKFAQFLEAVTRADDMSNHLIELDRPPGDEF